MKFDWANCPFLTDPTPGKYVYTFATLPFHWTVTCRRILRFRMRQWFSRSCCFCTGNAWINLKRENELQHSSAKSLGVKKGKLFKVSRWLAHKPDWVTVRPGGQPASWNQLSPVFWTVGPEQQDLCQLFLGPSAQTVVSLWSSAAWLFSDKTATGRDCEQRKWEKLEAKRTTVKMPVGQLLFLLRQGLTTESRVVITSCRLIDRRQVFWSENTGLWRSCSWGAGVVHSYAETSMALITMPLWPKRVISFPPRLRNPVSDWTRTDGISYPNTNVCRIILRIILIWSWFVPAQEMEWCVSGRHLLRTNGCK